MFGLRPLLNLFGERFNLLRAASRMAWRYVLLLEIANVAAKNYKFRSTHGSFPLLTQHLKSWKRAESLAGRLRLVLQEKLPRSKSAEEAIGELASSLEINQVQQALVKLLDAVKTNFVTLIDRLDEGYEPDELGTGLVNGLVLATLDLNVRLPRNRFVVFLRDNIGRAVANADPDYSRDIEGQVLRLHWDEPLLRNMACNRLKANFDLQKESNVKIWDRCTGSNLHGIEGFRQCLRLTLYRPRDLLSLLNQAFYRAAAQDRSKIVLEDIEIVARDISRTRLDDLHKEYGQIVPGLPSLTSPFSGSSGELTAAKTSELLTEATEKTPADGATKQHFEILGTASKFVSSLYSVGFLGVRDENSGTFVFCHDGSPNREWKDSDRVLIHPCYWMALGVSSSVLADTEAEEIHDEYEIRVVSDTPEIRKAQISKHIESLRAIPTGADGSSHFENWCLKTVKILFPAQLTNIELHPNRTATQRRDVVARNNGVRGVWKRVYDDYGTRQVVFEVKNKEGVEADDFRQVLSYLTGDYGKCAFLISRDHDINLRKGREVDWVRELYDKHGGVLVVKLTADFFCKLLQKLRNPQRHDEADVRIAKLLDDYTRLYLSGVATQTGRSRKRRRRKKSW